MRIETSRPSDDPPTDTHSAGTEPSGTEPTDTSPTDTSPTVTGPTVTGPTVRTAGASARIGLRRLPVLALAALALLAGLDAALVLLGLPAPVTWSRLPEAHATLLVFGFLGTLIALERGVALRHWAGFAAPLLFAVGALVQLAPAPMIISRVLVLAGTVALVGTYLPLWRRQRDHAVLVQTLGAVLAVGAAVLLLGGVEVRWVVGWLAGFVIVTIIGERLELARLMMGPHAGHGLLLRVGGFVLALLASLLWPNIGTPLFGVALLVLVGWAVRHDVARRTVHADGLPRFIAWSLLVGYGWLAVAGAIWLFGPAVDGARHDAVAHAVFLGFTLAMIMAHAPVILPALLRRALPYHWVLYLPATLLHASLVVRVWGGDALGIHRLHQVGGALNVAAVLLFVICAATLVVRGERGRTSTDG